ncbi:MAG TPA: dihydrofolate reductase family protein, partial [Rubrobacter sp.]|nr:dihydrofolate reductase family protein [Rubrobacter sp.]
LVEGGAGMITALLQARLVDRLVVCVAPKILGAGIEAVGDLGIHELARALLMTDTSVTPYGLDLVLDGRIEYPRALPMTVESEERVACVPGRCQPDSRAGRRPPDLGGVPRGPVGLTGTVRMTH